MNNSKINLNKVQEIAKYSYNEQINILADLLELNDFTPVYQLADTIRRENVGNQVRIRAIIEFSNYCKRRCAYCGLNANNHKLERYRMTDREIIDTAIAAAEAGYKTLVMQSGEDDYFTAETLGEIIKAIKNATNMAITVSCGERSYQDLAYLKRCGADRYLLKHETANPILYSKLHPCGTLQERVECLKNIKALGYETGGGFMIGLPGQTSQIIAADLLLLKEVHCDMAGIGPFIPHNATALKDNNSGNTETTKRAVALARILLPNANLPATTSLGVLNAQAKNDIFSWGANVVMKKVTPQKYKELYEIYPASLSVTDIITERQLLENQIRELDRIPD